MKYFEMIRDNNILGQKLQDCPEYKIRILSNISVFQLKEILEYTLRNENIYACVNLGDFDNIVQNSSQKNDCELEIIFWDFSGVLSDSIYRINCMSEKELENLRFTLQESIKMIFQNFMDKPLVLLNLFTSLAFTSKNVVTDTMDLFCIGLNDWLRKNIPSNFKLINIEKIISNLSVEKSFNYRDYYKAKMIYSVEFMKAYAEFVKPLVLGIKGKFRKILILDCDNTLWKGILGEDGAENLEFTPETSLGKVYFDTHQIILSMKKRGLLLGICSKNNEKDVIDFLKNNSKSTLRYEDFICFEINWSNKTDNLQNIAKQLNLSIDSFVFLDDSDFEINWVREKIPEIKCIQVPDKRYLYPGQVKNMENLFCQLTKTNEDIEKTTLYQTNLQREKEKSSFSDVDEYLSNLHQKMTLFVDDLQSMSRLSQLTQKTNQFNLTTRRYTEKQIESFIKSEDHRIYSFSLQDKFGDNGITGMAILGIQGKLAEIEVFLMSCRVLGRKAEFVFLENIVQHLKKTGIDEIVGWYISSQKNQQTEFYLDEFGFSLIEKMENSKKYGLYIRDYMKKENNIFEVCFNEKKN